MQPAPDPEKIKLLFGTYQQPALRRDDLAHCLVRDAVVLITTWSNARFSWPRGYVASGKVGCGVGLFVDEELARAIQCESALAVSYWWGIGRTTAAKWRSRSMCAWSNRQPSMCAWSNRQPRH